MRLLMPTLRRRMRSPTPRPAWRWGRTTRPHWLCWPRLRPRCAWTLRARGWQPPPQSWQRRQQRPPPTRKSPPRTMPRPLAPSPRPLRRVSARRRWRSEAGPMCLPSDRQPASLRVSRLQRQPLRQGPVPSRPPARARPGRPAALPLNRSGLRPGGERWRTRQRTRAGSSTTRRARLALCRGLTTTLRPLQAGWVALRSPPSMQRPPRLNAPWFGRRRSACVTPC
mmetsp:Transcript_11203/g.43211  ORF Transcript_11203/g.43211 Transcript_11203/m.43211 type:complete len:225 (+) Transcript_11203:285-959(+)